VCVFMTEVVRVLFEATFGTSSNMLALRCWEIRTACCCFSLVLFLLFLHHDTQTFFLFSPSD
jgi:hypothetical protein